MSSSEREQPSQPTSDLPVEEHPPGPSRRALRTMATVRWLLLALVTLVAGVAVWTHWGPGASDRRSTAEDRYYCSMHPQIRSPEPGECPICHMDLVPIPEEHQSTHQPAALGSVPSGPANVTSITVSDEKQLAVGLTTAPVESTTIGDRLRVPGVLSAPETGRSEVRVRAPGFVEQVSVRQTGVRVSAGQPLAFVYSPDIYRAQEEFIAAERWSAAPQPEGSSESGSTNIAASARRALELLGLSSAEIDQVSRTKQPIRAVAVRAPAAGVITTNNAVLGSRAGPEMVLYEIADLSNLWVIASVQERDLPALHVGTEARFTVSGRADEARPSKVDLIEPLLEEATRSARVRLVVQNREGRLRPGQFGEVEFDLPAAPGLFVPRDAVIRTGEHDYVYVASADDRFEPRSVTTGLARDGRVQVLTGLTAGERVVTRGSFLLDSESRLQASLSAVPQPPASAAKPAPPEPGP
jgi:Cu(I)/Ag(I) efflux system membrane fusion protein